MASKKTILLSFVILFLSTYVIIYILKTNCIPSKSKAVVSSNKIEEPCKIKIYSFPTSRYFEHTGSINILNQGVNKIKDFVFIPLSHINVKSFHSNYRLDPSIGKIHMHLFFRILQI
jgi:hypothetical protein